MRFEVAGLEVARGGAVVVAGWELACEAGEVVGVYGPSGSGKSSVLGALAGTVRSRGAVRIDGVDTSGQGVAERARRGLVLCPERRRVFAASSALDNLRMGAHAATKRQLAAALELVFAVFPALAAASVQRRPAGRLTAAEQQMLAIGRAVMAQPRVLLLDEPLQSVQPMLVPSVVDAVRRVAAARDVAVVVTDRRGDAWEGVASRAHILGPSMGKR